MKKRVKKKSRATPPQPAAGKPKASAAGTFEDDDIRSTDYGGIPDINLKKNLGCG